MSIDAQPAYNSEIETMTVIVSATGNGTGTPTKNYGKNIALTRTGVGAWLLTFQDPPGNLCGFGGDFQAATASQVAGYTAVAGTFTAASGSTKASLPVTIFTGGTTPAAVDLTSTQTLYITLDFKRAQSTV